MHDLGSFALFFAGKLASLTPLALNAEPDDHGLTLGGLRCRVQFDSRSPWRFCWC